MFISPCEPRAKSGSSVTVNFFREGVVNLKVAIVGLRRKPERAARVSMRLDTIGVVHELFPAVDGTLGEHLAWKQYDDAACIRGFGASLLPEEIGCFASHFSLWQRCAREGVPVLVLEDDVTLLDDFADVVELARQRIQTFRLIRLCGLFDERFRVVEDLGERKLIRYLKAPLGGQAYMVSPDGAAALVQAASIWREPMDHLLDRFWVHGVLPYAILPFAAIHEEAAEKDTSIGLRNRKRKGWNKFRREINRMRDQIGRGIYNLRH